MSKSFSNTSSCWFDMDVKSSMGDLEIKFSNNDGLQINGKQLEECDDDLLLMLHSAVDLAWDEKIRMSKKNKK